MGGCAIPLHGRLGPLSLVDTGARLSLLAHSQGLPVFFVPLFGTWSHLVTVRAATPRVCDSSRNSGSGGGGGGGSGSGHCGS
eukprot:COSAG01_NODE_28499_length_659_cov_2.112500_1_plen_81_part_10